MKRYKVYGYGHPIDFPTVISTHRYRWTACFAAWWYRTFHGAGAWPNAWVVHDTAPSRVPHAIVRPS